MLFLFSRKFPQTKGIATNQNTSALLQASYSDQLHLTINSSIYWEMLL